MPDKFPHDLADSVHGLDVGSGMTDAELQQANLDSPVWHNTRLETPVDPSHLPPTVDELAPPPGASASTALNESASQEQARVVDEPAVEVEESKAFTHAEVAHDKADDCSSSVCLTWQGLQGMQVGAERTFSAADDDCTLPLDSCETG